MGVGRSGPATEYSRGCGQGQANIHRGCCLDHFQQLHRVSPLRAAAPFELTNYANVKKRARLIAKVTEDRYMPPWHPVDGHGKFLDERRLSEVELATLKNWQKSGMAEGPADKLPEPPKFESDWLLGEPDLIVTMPKAFTVPADGPDIYRNFVIPLDLKEDKWVAGFEVRPALARCCTT